MNALQRHRALNAIWGAPAGWRGTVQSVNHSDIGKRFVIAAFVFFAIAVNAKTTNNYIRSL